jgi:excisionase family DNA binding protein
MKTLILPVPNTKVQEHGDHGVLPSGEQAGSSSEREQGSSGVAPILLTEMQVSQLLQVSLARIRKWRVEKRGPRFIKVGSLVRYRRADLEQWVSSLPTGGGEAAGR